MKFKEWLNEGQVSLEKLLPKIKGWDVTAHTEDVFSYYKEDPASGNTLNISFESINGKEDFAKGAKVTWKLESDDPMERGAKEYTLTRKMRDLNDIKNSIQEVLKVAKNKYKAISGLKL